MSRSFVLFASCLLSANLANAGLIFSTGSPDGKIGMASRPGPGPGGGANQETEAADDFIFSSPTLIDSATFAGLVPTGVNPSTDISQVVVEIYRVFPSDSDTSRTSGPPTFSTGNVPTRVNSPSDVELLGRDSAALELTFTTSDLGSFTVNNSVDLGIHPKPGETTGGDGSVTGEEVSFTTQFSSPILLLPGHYFFVPQVLLANPDDHFLWLSAPRPITAGTGPFAPDLQAWIRNADLDPDWLRVGTDIVGAGTFNGTFSLSGTEVPEPGTLLPLTLLAGLSAMLRLRMRPR